MAPDALRLVVVFVAVVATILAASVGVGTLVGPTQPTVQETEGPAVDTAALQTSTLSANGTVETDLDVDKTLVVDRAHRNRFDREDIQPLLTAATEAGFEIQFVQNVDFLSGRLQTADALLVVDPALEYDPLAADAVQKFVEDGGQLLVAGEPNRGVLRATGIGTARSQTTQLTTRFGITIGTDALYNMEQNDGNFRNVPVYGTDHGFVADVEEAILTNPAPVASDDGRPILRATRGTARSSTGETDPYVVGVRDDNVVVLGDSSFLGGERHAVGGNEALIGDLLEFLAE